MFETVLRQIAAAVILIDDGGDVLFNNRRRRAYSTIRNLGELSEDRDLHENAVHRYLAKHGIRVLYPNQFQKLLQNNA